jgi:tRNA A37 threonylcarbamoyladenosine synthetase subunit TsaC/SUA5/YrdC
MRIETPTPEAIAQAAAVLRRGELVAFPTETVYGVGGDATSDRAVAEIFAANERIWSRRGDSGASIPAPRSSPRGSGQAL